MSYAAFNDENEASSSTFQPNDFQASAMIVSSSASNYSKEWLTTEPWNSLELPPVKASEKLMEVLDLEELKYTMKTYEQITLKHLTLLDKDGNTLLMTMLKNPITFEKYKEHVIPLVKKVKNVPGVLEIKTKSGESALFLAAIQLPEMPYVCGYLAAVMLQQGIDINQTLDDRGNTLIHYIAKQGDSHVKVLVEILTLLKDNSALDLSKINNYGQTALHSAVKNHVTNVKVLDTTKMLLENGVDLRVKDKNGDTALHLAVAKHCDPELTKILLWFVNPTIVIEKNNLGDTPLHLTAELSGNVDLEKQKEVCRLLISAGALTNLQNREGLTPLDLVSLERKEVIKKILYRTK